MSLERSAQVKAGSLRRGYLEKDGSLACFAPAKVNLALHVTGHRADGYHLLDSLVCFAGVGDVLRAEPAADLSLTLSGPEAAGLEAGGDNLVLRAARLFGAGQGARVHLVKQLPVASGIGGGSSDAAAALHLLAALWDRDLPPLEQVLGLGADVPVCMAGQVCRMGGVGERLDPVPELPPVWAVLANPRHAVATPAVFKALESKDNPSMPARVPQFFSALDLARWLSGQRNDLEAAAIAVAPVIAEVINDLARLRGALLARMSGSGATCFALFDSAVGAESAAAELARLRPDFWVAAAPLGPVQAVSPRG